MSNATPKPTAPTGPTPKDLFFESRGLAVLRAATKPPRFSHRDIATACGVSPSTVGDWIEGKVLPDTTNLKRLADMLALPVDAFFEHVDPTDGGC